MSKPTALSWRCARAAAGTRTASAARKTAERKVSRIGPRLCGRIGVEDPGMKQVLATIMLAASAALPASAQTTDAGFWLVLSPSLANTAKVMHASIRRNLAEAAEKMPADEYSFRPAAES